MNIEPSSCQSSCGEILAELSVFPIVDMLEWRELTGASNFGADSNPE